ncbi:hypothetical protein ES703_37652 [subsurface metagenome]
MKKEPPEGSKIKVEQDVHSTTYMWKDDDKMFTKLGHLAFSVFLIGFAVAFWISAIRHLVSESNKWNFGLPLLLAFVFTALCATGGFFFFFITLKSKKPFKLILSPRHIQYKIGDINFRAMDTAKFRDLNDLTATIKKYRKRIYEAETSKITNLRLERVGDRQRLSFDWGADRVEIGETLSDIEREWLYEILKEHKRN